MRIPAVVVASFVLVVAPPLATAQFTAAVIPPNAMLIDSTHPAAIPRVQGMQAKAISPTEMRPGPLHIDSSLGAIETRAAGQAADSVNPTEDAAAKMSPTVYAVHPFDSDPDGDTTFRDGASAPETESPLPLVALAGVGTLLIGVALFRR